jgi:putative restriction endonuclease
MQLPTILKPLINLRVASNGGVQAPHKAVLLLAVLQGIEMGEMRDNRIYITPELVARFKDLWHLLVHDIRFTANFSLPFYHLKTSGFWQLHTYAGREILVSASHSIKSFAALKDSVAYASLSDDVFAALLDATNRAIVRRALLDKYLGGQQLRPTGYDMLQVVEQQILHEPASAYKKDTAGVDDEELFVRSGVFKKVIPRVYNNACCISGMQIIATRDVQMIDACHIVPFAVSHDDTIRNGLALSPNFHRAFDRFLISINEDYRVVVSKDFTEAGVPSLRAFEGKKIYLPREVGYRPGAEHVRWHYEQFLGR